MRCVVQGIDPQSPATLYLGTHGWGAFKSTDGGSHWSASDSGLIDHSIRSPAIDLVTPTILYAGVWGSVYKTIDGGDNWTAVDTGLTDAGSMP
jgi:photosystem II stability/assembly factor-like uncharacterized protein